MAESKPFDKGKIGSIIGEILDPVLKGLDKLDLFENDGLLSAVPFGKLGKYFGEKLVITKDKDEAFNKVFNIAYFTTFYNALIRYNINIFDVDPDKLKDLKGYSPGIFIADEFDVNNFFSGSNAIIENYKYKFEKFLSDVGIDEKLIKKIFLYIDDYLEFDFYDILETSKTKFREYNEYLKSKKYEISLEIYKRRKYSTEIKNEFTGQLLFEETGMSLSDIYVEPDFKVHEFCFDENENKFKNKDIRENKGFFKIRNNYDDSLHKFIDEVLDEKPFSELKASKYRLLLLLGYPGQGKSSFCKKFIYDKLNDLKYPKKIFLFKFKYIEKVTGLLTDPINTIKESIESWYKIKIDDNEFNKAIIILDGFDEICMRNRLNSDQIDDIIKEFIRSLETLEVKQNAEMKIIITSRLGFVNIEKLKTREILVLHLDEFNITKQKEWLSKYKIYHPKTFLNEELIDKYNREEKYKYLKELISQPLLILMVASIKISINKDINRAELYKNLFDNLIERKYEKDKQIEALKDITKDDLRRFIREIALAIYQTEHEYIYKSKLLKIKAADNFQKKLNITGLKDSLKGIMIAFYFRETRKDYKDEEEDSNSDYAIEFLHKSFYEYMTAEKIWEEMVLFIDKNNRTSEYVVNNFEEALKIFSNLFSKRIISIEIVGYLSEIINNDKNLDKKELLERLMEFFPKILEKDFLFSYDIKQDINPIYLSLRTFYGFWSLVSNLFTKKEDINEKIKQILENNKSKFIEIIKILISCNLRDKLFINLAYQNFSGANLRGADLMGAKFYGANFFIADLRGANLYDADLRYALCFGTNLSNAVLSHVDLSCANLRGAILSDAYLIVTYLRNVDLRDANLSNTHILSSNLYGANLTNIKIDEYTLFEETELVNIKIDRKNYNYLLKRGIEIINPIIVENDILYEE